MAAVRLFDGRLPLERAKAANARGAVLRLSGRLDEAAASFREALEGFRRGESLGLARTVWFAHLLVSYLLVPVACDWGTALPLHATTVVAAVVALGGSAIAVRAAQGEHGREHQGAAAFVLRAGTITRLVFGTIIVPARAATVLVDPC